MTNRWLNEITNIKGVEAVLLVTNKGQIIEEYAPRFELSLLEQVSLTILRMFAVNRLLQKDVREIELVWYNFHITAMSSDILTMIIFSNLTKTLSLLRITISVVMAHLLEDRKIIKKVKKHTIPGVDILEHGNLNESEINLISKLQ